MIGHAPNAERDKLLRLALWLVGGTLGYNVIEGVIAVWFGSLAESPVLIAFGLDSVIECFAAGVLLWRLWAPQENEQREILAQKLIGYTFLALALFVVVQSASTLLTRQAPSVSAVGMVLGCLSLAIMPILSWAKLRVASRLDSKALRAEALETLACTYLTVTMLGGLVANAAFHWWWADPAAALVMLPWLIKEGMEGVRARCC